MSDQSADGLQTEEERERIELALEKHAQARRLLAEAGLDLWLTFTREGSDVMLPFVTGMPYIAGTSALMIFADGPTVAVVADYDRIQVEGIFDEVHAYSGDWRDAFLQTLRDRDPKSIALNYSESDFGIDGLTHGLYLQLVRELTPLGMADRLVSSEPVAERIRALKTPGEVERIRRACQITQQIFDDVTGVLKVGMTEMDVHEFINERMETYGVSPAWEAQFCPAVFTGDQEAGHRPPSQKVIAAGDTVRIDFGVVVEGYCSDMQRTWYMARPGETGPSEDAAHRFAAVADAVALAVSLIKPGVVGWDVDKPSRGLVEERGYGFTHAFGHQVGRLVHDGGLVLGPNNARYGDRSGGQIEEGMVFTLEPCIQGAQIEEDIVVTADGCEYLVPPQTALYIVPSR
ncbi:MAG TPA: M24 family metallopeptidase [Thermomicrobiales bacterium]|jgi:Xaa-Pro aminopeptidase|nr:M24 family metallopeptidase [Thermomicrobiales bacterium]